MNRRPRRPQRQAPPLRGRAATLPSLNSSTFAPLSTRTIPRQPRPSRGFRENSRLGQPYPIVQPHSDAHDNICQETSETLQPLKPLLQWGDWVKRWRWFIGLALAIMAIAISIQR